MQSMPSGNMLAVSISAERTVEMLDTTGLAGEIELATRKMLPEHLLEIVEDFEKQFMAG